MVMEGEATKEKKRKRHQKKLNHINEAVSD